MSGVRRERVCIVIYMCGKYELRSETRYRQPGCNAPETESSYTLNLGDQSFHMTKDDFFALKAIMAEAE